MARQSIHMATDEALSTHEENANVRFMLDFLHSDIQKRFSTAAGGGIAGTPLGAPVGGEFDALVMRTQFAF
jgi:hypothetical protein